MCSNFLLQTEDIYIYICTVYIYIHRWYIISTLQCLVNWYSMGPEASSMGPVAMARRSLVLRVFVLRVSGHPFDHSKSSVFNRRVPIKSILNGCGGNLRDCK